MYRSRDILCCSACYGSAAAYEGVFLAGLSILYQTVADTNQVCASA